MLEGTDLSDAHRQALLHVDVEGWRGEFDALAEFLDGFGNRLPQALRDERARIHAGLGKG